MIGEGVNMLILLDELIGEMRKRSLQGASDREKILMVEQEWEKTRRQHRKRVEQLMRQLVVQQERRQAI